MTDETLLRRQVAACTLLLNDLGLLGYSGHVSARLPGRDALLIQPTDQPRLALSPDDLLTVDFTGRKIAGPEGVAAPDAAAAARKLGAEQAASSGN